MNDSLVSAAGADSPAITLRPATRADLDAVVRVDVRSFTRHWPADDFAAQLVDPLVCIWLADAGKGALGYVHVRVVGDEAELLNIAVDPDGRRLGLGERLLRHAMSECAELGVGRVFLEVRADNHAAMALYRRCAWEQVGIRKRYYSEDGADAIVMSVDLIDPLGTLDAPIGAQ